MVITVTAGTLQSARGVHKGLDKSERGRGGGLNCKVNVGGVGHGRGRVAALQGGLLE